MNRMETLILVADDVQHVVRHVGLDAFMDDLIEKLTGAFLGFDPDTTVIPIRRGFAYTEPATGLVEWMPCWDRQSGVTLKVVGYHPANGRRHALPTIVSTISAYETDSGHLRCLMDGTLLTALRTGAATAIASRAMASPDARVVGLIGVGAQAVTQLHALTRCFNLQRCLIYDVDPTSMDSFADRIACFDPGLRLERATPDEVARQADILCTATSVDLGAGPVFPNTTVKSALHINAVGSDFPGKIEVPRSLLLRAFVCPDCREQAILEGECQQLPQEAIGPELYQVLQSRPAELRERLTVFDSTGWALEDHAAMDLVVERALALGLGTRLPIEMVPEDARNPYHFAARRLRRAVSVPTAWA